LPCAKNSVAPTNEPSTLRFNVTLGLLDAQINRPTIAAVLQVLSSIFKKKKKSPLVPGTEAASPTVAAIAADKLPSGAPISSVNVKETSRGLARASSAANPYNYSQAPNAGDLLKLLRQRDAYVSMPD